MSSIPAVEMDFIQRSGAALERISIGSIGRSRDAILIAAAVAAQELAHADALCAIPKTTAGSLVAVANDERVITYRADARLRDLIGVAGQPHHRMVTKETSNLWIELPSGNRLHASDVVAIPLGDNAEMLALAFCWGSDSAITAERLSALQAIAWTTGIALRAQRSDEKFQRSHQHQHFQIAELQRRIRNNLAIVRSIIRRSGESAESHEDFTSHLEARISALARIQGALTIYDQEGPELEDLLRGEMTANAVRENQFEIQGASIRLSTKAAESLALAMHELTTNALKFGALAFPGGHIAITWNIASSDTTSRLRLSWTESGAVLNLTAPRRRGFGQELIERVLPYELDAFTTFTLQPGGLRCEIDMPLNERTRDTSSRQSEEDFHDDEADHR